MEKTIKLIVNKDDIRLGQKRDMCNCPVGLALKRKFRHRPVRITNDGLLVGNAGDDKVFICTPLPAHIWNFIGDFDAGQRVMPFKANLTFEVWK